jgi:spore coat polysaccharide biosynthesis predicted glycosyltransferase SpsG
MPCPVRPARGLGASRSNVEKRALHDTSFSTGFIDMSKFPILIRCDATSSQGYESFYQCLTYANALQRRRRGIHFLSRLEPNTILSSIQKGGHDWRPAEYPLGSNEDLRETLGVIRQYQAAAIIVSDPGVSFEYLNALAATGALLVVMDNRASARYPRCLLLNTLLGPNRDSFDATPGTQMLMGQRFALVRPFIRRLRPMRAQEPPAPFRAMIAFGDDDFRGQVRDRANQLLAISRIERIDVAIRAQHPAFMELIAMKEANPDRLDVVTEPADISLRLSRCHLALTSGDSWSLELACIGIPQLMLVQSNWHMLNAQRLDDEGAAMNLGDCESVSASELRQAVQNLLSEPRDRAAMARAGRKLIDGRGPDRMVNGMEVMLQGPLPTASSAGRENIAA